MKTAGLLLLSLSSLTACAIAGGDGSDFGALCFGKCDNGVSLELESGPAMFTYDELVTLSTLRGRRVGKRYVLDGAPAGLEDKLNRLVDTPFVNNHAFQDGFRPYRPGNGAGTIKVLGWNIEEGQQLDAIVDAFRGEDAFMTHVPAEKQTDAALKRTIEDQLDDLQDIDVIALSEVDRGVRRSGYHDVVAELAKELGMNWAYATEFIEIDPIAIGTEVFTKDDFATTDANTGQVIDDGATSDPELGDTVAELNQMIQVDPDRLHAIHGNAILSRYPIVSARAIPLQTVCWDWNAGEWQGRQWVQRELDVFNAKVFLEKTMRQVRHGGRTVLIADLYVPGVNAKGTTLEYVPGVSSRANLVTVISAHLENTTTPKCRRQQMQEILGYVKDVQNPVVLSGDLNTFGSDGRPLTIQKLLVSRFGNPEWIARQLIGHFVPYAGWVFMALDVVNFFRLKDDPTGANIPILLPNPERGLFDAVENQQFADWARFDFRGDASRTVNGTRKTLANSNQRDSKGFKTTSALERDLGLGGVSIFGRWKIDWIFVKAFARSPRDGKASYRMAPHFPKTLEELRDYPEPRLSDHAPMTVELPIGDECKDGQCQGDPATGPDFGDTTWVDENATGN